MGKNTGIQWCDTTVNPTSGCDGCELWIPGRGGPCYAGNLHETRLAKSLPQLYDPVFTNVRLIPGRMAKVARCMDLTGIARPAKPWLGTLRAKYFIGDLGDLFSAAVPFEFLKQEIVEVATGRDGSRHDWLLLTKQPRRVVQFAEWLEITWPENLWVGTSITGKASLSRISHLQQVPALHRYLSLEPLVEDPELTPAHLTGIDWIIVGGESDQGKLRARSFQLAWVRRIIELGYQLGIAVFVKQLGSSPQEGAQRLGLRDTHGGDWEEWPEALRVRQLPFTSL